MLNEIISRTNQVTVWFVALTVMPPVILASGSLTQHQGDGVRVSGRLVDQDGNPRNVSSAAVFLIDAESGRPLLGESQLTVGRANGMAGPDGWLHVITDSFGQFSFSRIPPGRYRVAAQSWLGRESVPTRKDADSVLAVHGSSQPFTVGMDNVDDVEIVALGSAVLTIQTEPDEGNAYLFIGTAEPMADPIMGPWFWGQEFISSIAGVTHMKRGRQIVQGLPSDGTVHAMLLNYDNNAGAGGVSVDMFPVAEATLPIYATWSNGYYQPPERLENLVEWLRTNEEQFAEVLANGDAKAAALLPVTRERYDDYIDWLTQHGREMRTVDGVGTFTVLDLVAAQNYLRILEFHEARQARAAASQQSSSKTPPDDIP